MRKWRSRFNKGTHPSALASRRRMAWSSCMCILGRGECHSLAVHPPIQLHPFHFSCRHKRALLISVSRKGNIAISAPEFAQGCFQKRMSFQNMTSADNFKKIPSKYKRTLTGNFHMQFMLQHVLQKCLNIYLDCSTFPKIKCCCGKLTGSIVGHFSVARTISNWNEEIKWRRWHMNSSWASLWHFHVIGCGRDRQERL